MFRKKLFSTKEIYWSESSLQVARFTTYVAIFGIPLIPYKRRIAEQIEILEKNTERLKETTKELENKIKEAESRIKFLKDTREQYYQITYSLDKIINEVKLK